MRPDHVVRLLGVQMQKIANPAGDSRFGTVKMGACILPELRPASRKFQTVSAKQLMVSQKLGGPRRMGQFSFEFPITGPISHRFVYPSDGKVQGRPPPSQLFRKAAHRFRERSAKSGFKNAIPLRAESLERVKKGWLSPPVPLAHDGKPIRWRPNSYDISFRFGVLQ